ncbi:MAG: aldehyde dehydrogenase family protein [Bdellovibrionales bacterium]|nr:aldehyde dehydrogenase family protein [Bdellovibrionales bacterium]
MDLLSVRNPATGELLKELPLTPTAELRSLFERASEVQKRWAAVPLKDRVARLYSLRETLINHVDDLSELISNENGKPRFEAMVNEIFAAIELCTYFAKNGEALLADSPIPMGLMKHRASYLNYWPLGVIAVITPWNYPFLLPMGELVMGVLAGNAIIFKPSEITPLIGLRLQEIFEEAGFPKGLINTVVGDGATGAAIIDQRPAKIFFTGSVATGKKIMRAASEHLIPVNLELGGKDPMIVLDDADLDFATSAALWGGFSNSGQICASVERILVHESVATEFKRRLKEKIATLRQGVSRTGNNDLGAITFEKQKDIYASQIRQAKERGAEFVTGGEFSADRRFLQPTVVTGEDIESLDIYNEETFGPVVALTTFRTIDEAVEKANRSKYGLLASVITRDISKGEEIAKRIEAGTITINEVVYTAGLPETPWGGVKETGFGRKHSARGLYEFVNTRHIHKPVAGVFVFKSLWWFPYTPFQHATFRKFIEFYRNSWFAKLRALPGWVSNLIRFITREPRI